MGIADFILAGEGDLYDLNEYHMLAHIIIRNMSSYTYECTIIFILFLSCLLIIVQYMLRNGQTGHTWHLVVDHIMLVMKMRSSSPANRPVKGIYVQTCTKKK